MRRLLTINDSKGLMTMFQSFNNFGRKQVGSANAVANEVSIKLRMPAGYQGRTVPTSIVMMELLWQQYGLDVLHPEVNRWLERNAPEVKSAMVENRLVRGNEGGQAKFPVSSKGTIELNLSLKVDDRLRDISSRYILSQVGVPTETQTELLRAA